MLTAGTIINGGLRLVRERPASVLAWGVLYLGVTVAGLFLILWPVLQQLARADGGYDAFAFNHASIIASVYLLDLVALILVVVLMAAGMRAVLRPEARALAYLRLGMDELRLLGLFLLLVLCVFALSLVLGFVIALVFGLTMAGSGATGNAGSGAPLVIFPLMLVLYAAIIFVQVRLSPALALTMIREKIVVGEAWRLTRGRFWTLFGGYLVLGLILFAAYAAILLLLLVPFSGVFAQAQTRPELAIAAATTAVEQLGTSGLTALGLLAAAAFAMLAGVAIAFSAGGVATATAALLEAEDGTVGALQR